MRSSIMKDVVITNIHANSDNLLTNPYSGILFAFDKRRRNLEKRKMRLMQYEEDLSNGKELSEQQMEAHYCLGEVNMQLQFLKQLNKTMNTLQKDYLKCLKSKQESVHKEEEEKIKRCLESFIGYQNVASHFNDEGVRKAFLIGEGNTNKITEDELKVIEDLNEKLNYSVKFSNVMEKSRECAEYIYPILTGSVNSVNDHSGAEILEIFKKITFCNFEQDQKSIQKICSDSHIELSAETDEKKEERNQKVNFMHGISDSQGRVNGNQIVVDGEFGFENGVDAQLVIRDPPPPIPLPITVPEDPTANENSNHYVIKSDKCNVWTNGKKSNLVLNSETSVSHNIFVSDPKNGDVACNEPHLHNESNGHCEELANENDFGNWNEQQEQRRGLAKRGNNRGGRRMRTGRAGGHRGSAFPPRVANGNSTTNSSYVADRTNSYSNGQKASGGRIGFSAARGGGQTGPSQAQQYGFNFSSDASRV